MAGKRQGEGYYYVDGKFWERMSPSVKTVQRICKRHGWVFKKATPFRHPVTGNSTRIDLATKKK